MKHPRCTTYKTADGQFGEVPSSFFAPGSLPDGAEPCLYEERYYPSHKAVDHYHHYKEDIALLAGMGMNVYRFSICWSRIFPTGEERQPNEEGFRFYDAIFDELEKHGMQPLVTIHHDELPVALAVRYDAGPAATPLTAMYGIARLCLSGMASDANTGSPSTRSMRFVAL